MLGAKAFPLALLLALIVLQCTSAATPAPKEAQKSPAPAPASASPAPQAKLQNSNAGASKQQYQGPAERSYGAEEDPNRSMKRGEPKDRPYAEQRSGDGYSKYGRDSPKPYPKPADSYGPDYGAKGPYDGPRDAYDEPKDAYNSEPGEDGYGESKPKPAPCPKAKSADAVADVLRKRDDGSLAVGTFCWKDEAITAAKAARNSRKSQTRAARKASTEPEDVSLDAEPATDAEAKVSIASVGVASVGATRKAGAAVRTAAAKPSYGRDPGMYDPASLLEVAPEISGKGVTGTYSDKMVPTAEALAVGPHVGPNANPSFATVLHAVNAVAEIFYMSKKSGMAIRTAAFRNTGKVSSTKLDLEKIAAFADPAAATLTHGDPSAFFDVEAERWVLVWSSYPDEDSKTSASVFVAVSHEVDPLEKWTVYSLEARPQITNGYLFCEGNSHMFSPMAPQISFSDKGIFISIGAHCATPTDADGNSFYPDTTPGIMSVLFAYSKAALYDCENIDSDRKIYAATYMGPMAWKSSISYKEQSLIMEDYRTFNNLITPARPQDEKDVKDDPLFVMKVDHAYLSVATLTPEPLDKMDCIENAPSIRAVIIGKGEDFSNTNGEYDGAAILPQTEEADGVRMDAGDCGMLGGKYGIRTYGTIHHRGLLYTTMCEFFGQHELRMPSIYWAIIATHPGSGLCKAARKKWGFIASADGLGLAYPVIAAKHDGGALVVYAYAGSDQLPSSLGPAHPGVAATAVGGKGGYGYEQAPSINIVKLGEDFIQQCDENHSTDCIARWGDYSASQVYGGHMWFAVPYAGEVHTDYRSQWRSWIAVEGL